MNNSLYNEIYSNYYHTMSKILDKFVRNYCTISDLYEHLNNKEDLLKYLAENGITIELFKKEFENSLSPDDQKSFLTCLLEIAAKGSSEHKINLNDFQKTIKGKSFEQTLCEKNREVYDKIINENVITKTAFYSSCEHTKLITKNYDTTVNCTQHIPLTTIQKRFIKNMIQDERALLFIDEYRLQKLKLLLNDVSPLYNPESIVTYDAPKHPDNFSDTNYKKIFREIIGNHSVDHSNPKIKLETDVGIETKNPGDTVDFEYSCDLDKFFFKFWTSLDNEYLIPMDKIKDIEYTEFDPIKFLENYDSDKVDIISSAIDYKKRNETASSNTVTFEIQNNTLLDQILYIFSYLKKDCTKIDENKSILKVKFEQDDVNELINKMLYFGPDIKITSSTGRILIDERDIEEASTFFDTFYEKLEIEKEISQQLYERLKKQKELLGM